MDFITVYSYIIPIITLLALLYAGIEDILFREVRREIIWILMICIGIIMDILYLVFYPKTPQEEFYFKLAEMLISIILGFLIGVALFYLGVWGGADSKAIWSIAIISPIYPFPDNILNLPIISNNFLDLSINTSVFSILLNSALLTLFYPLLFILINSIRTFKKPIFDEVRAKTSEKIRCFLFGFQKKISTINPKKIHFDFFEELPQNEFQGSFNGDFSGKLDGTFIGLFSGKLKGEFTGTILGKFLSTNERLFEEVDLTKAIEEAEKIVKTVKNEKKNSNDEEKSNLIIEKYLYILDNSLKEGLHDTTSNINFDGQFNESLNVVFMGKIEGLFDGKLNGKLLGKIQGDFYGNSNKGKISGTKINESRDWKIKIRMGLDDEDIMEKRKLKILWQLKNSNKKFVWITPGLPFVALFFFGYILYMLFGNIATLLFQI